jgi:uncharacterized membrane protein
MATMATTFPGNVRKFGAQAAAESVPVVRTLRLSDLATALRKGLDDFKAVPSHAVILCVVYPVLGILIARIVLGYSVMPLLFPLAAGFALIGPFAAIGLYEMSRRRELGEDASAWHAFQVLRSPSFGAILGLGVMLLALFVTWIFAAQAIYEMTFGNTPAASMPDFVERVLTTPEGWMLIIVGCGVGFVFALVSLCLSVVSFPMMLDRHAGAAEAMVTSLRVALANPFVIAMWGLIVAALLVIGTLPLFLGLCVVIPVLGHATWHLYRLAVEPDSRPRYEPPPKIHHSAADFPVALFPWAHDKHDH